MVHTSHTECNGEGGGRDTLVVPYTYVVNLIVKSRYFKKNKAWDMSKLLKDFYYYCKQSQADDNATVNGAVWPVNI